MTKSAPPSRTRAILVNSFSEPCFVGEVPLKKPSLDEVVIKMEAAPINPSDLLFLRGGYGTHFPMPWTPGLEGSGTVIHASKKWANLLGKRVACRFQSGNHGTWAEYLVTSGSRCMILPKDVDFTQGSMLSINPLTALGLIHKARKWNHRAAVQTAGMSQVSQMTLRLAKRLKFPLIFVVRNDSHVHELKNMGAKYVLNSSGEDFTSALRTLCAKLKATVAFDAIGGDFTGTLLEALPTSGEVWSYGGLSGEPCKVPATVLTYGNKSLHGFWVTQWQSTLNKKEIAAVFSDLSRHAAKDFCTPPSKVVAPNAVASAIQEYRSDMSRGKIVLDLTAW